jgi:hypothetical protein
VRIHRAQAIDVEEQIDLMYIDAVRDVKLLALAYPEMYNLAMRIMAPHRAEILNNTMKVPLTTTSVL